jgi:DNA-binding LacI/PurR family transcriptional regulator
MAIVKQEDIAIRAGVSRATVSVVLGGRADVVGIKKSKREHVLKVAREMGYCCNQSAKQLTTGKSNVICFYSRDFKNEYTSSIIAGMLREAENKDFFIKNVGTKSVNEFVRYAVVNRIAGIIIRNTSAMPKKIILEAQANNIPIAYIGEADEKVRCTCVNQDDAQGAYLAVKHLYESGHRKIALLVKSKRRTSHIEGFQKAIEHFKLSEASIIKDAFSINKEALIQAVSEKRFTSFICWSDHDALRLMKILYSKGYKIPEDFSIIGCGDMAFCELLFPALTSVHHYYEEIGKVAICELFKKINDGQYTEIKNIKIPVKLIKRESVKAIVNAE